MPDNRFNPKPKEEMEKKHTKGPWYVDPDYSVNQDETRDIDGPNNELIARVMVDFERTGPDKKTGNANAKLIAAAPDLLEALIWAVSELEYLNSGTQDERVATQIQMAKSALAKSKTE